MLKEFKKFIKKGNVLEMAVGLIMATYFGAIAKSLVNDVIMPPIGLFLNGVDFSDLKVILQAAAPESAPGAGDAIPEVAITYGVFINSIITFIVVAFSIFLLLKSYNKMKERLEIKEEPKAEKLNKQESLLTEIRDLLKKQNEA
jgi:large conductance mechanosensitive channel